MSSVSALARVADSSPVIIHTLRFTTQSEDRISTQENTTTEKVSNISECIICFDARITDQTPRLIHQTNQDCDLYKNKQVCHICLPKLERCPICRENLTTGEMQNSLAGILVEMQQNNLQEQAEEENPLALIAQNQQVRIVNINVNVQNFHPPQQQQIFRCTIKKVFCIIACPIVMGMAGLIIWKIGQGFGYCTDAPECPPNETWHGWW